MMEQNRLNFQKEVLEAEKPVIIDFGAVWCGYCRRLSPVLDRLEESLEGAVKILRVDVDEEPELAQKFEIDTIPALIVFQHGVASETLVNPPSQSAIVDWLRENKAL